MGNINELVDRYLEAWNERDARKRHELIARTWCGAGTYVDPARHGEGHEGIDAMIATAQEHFNSSYRLRLKSAVEAHNGRVRFTWETGGTREAPMHIVGTDFGVVGSDGRFESVTGFVDEAPGATPNH